MNDAKQGIPEVRIVELALFRAVTSGLDSFDRVMGDFNTWQEGHGDIIRPMLYGAPDFLYGEDGKAEWLWAVRDGVTQADVAPYYLREFAGGLYAVATTVDGDEDITQRVLARIRDWIEHSGFEADERPGRRIMYHMLHPTEEIRAALGYDQTEIFVPVRIGKKENGE